MFINKKIFHYTLFFMMCVIWSTTWAVVKIGLKDAPPSIALTLRFAIASILLFLISILSGKKLAVDRDSLKLYFIIGLFNMALSYFCTYWGMQYIPSSLSSILWTSMPLLTGLLAHFFVAGERLNIRRLISIIISTIGVITILSDQTLIFNTRILLGSLVTLAAIVFAGFPNIYLKNWNKPYDSIVLTAFALGFAAVFHFLNATFLGHWAKMEWNFVSVGCAVYLGVFGSATTFSIYFYLIRHVQVVKLSFLTFITPIFASLIGFWFLKELVTLQEIAGMLIIISGLFLFDWKKYLNFIRKLIKH